MKTKDTKNYDRTEELKMDLEPPIPNKKNFPGYDFCPMHGSFPEDPICHGVICNGKTKRCIK